MEPHDNRTDQPTETGRQQVQPSASEHGKIPVIKEEVTVGKKQVDDKTISIKKEVVEHNVEKQIPLKEEKVNIERIPKNIEVKELPITRHEGNKTIIPIVKEVYVKKIILVEEIHVEKSMDEHLKQVSEVVREEQVDIQAEPSNKTD
jgi:uncharacterized protein (TIGR02271 family)